MLSSTKKNIEPWLLLFKQTVDSLKIHPALLFNLDETPISLTEHYHYSELKALDEPKPTAMMSERMANITVVLTIPALGSALPTILLWPSKTLPQELTTLAAFDIVVIPNGTGWQTISSFENMMMTILLPAIIKKRETLGKSSEYALLLLDSHASRFTSTVWEFCMANKIAVLTIPSHTSHILQPLDRSCNGVLKRVFFNQMIKQLNKAIDAEPELGQEINLEPLMSPTRHRKPHSFLPTQPQPHKPKMVPINPSWIRACTYINDLAQRRQSRIFHPPQLRFVPSSPIQSNTIPLTATPVSTQPLTISQSSPQHSLQQPLTTTTDEMETTDVLRLHGGYKANRRRKLSVDPDWHPDSSDPVTSISHAAGHRILFVSAFPVAVQKATSKEVAEHGWRESGLYPFNSGGLLQTLSDGPEYHPRERDALLISGKLLTTPSLIMNLKKLEAKRNDSRLIATKQKQDTDYLQQQASKRTESNLHTLTDTFPSGPASSMWVPKLASTITASATHISHPSPPATDTYPTTIPESTPPFTTELLFTSGTIVLPSIDSSLTDEKMAAETID